MFCGSYKKEYVRTTNNSFMKGIDSMRKRNIISTIVMVAITASIFTGCKPTIPDDGTGTSGTTTAASTEATTTEIQKAPVTLYANFDNEVLNDAPTTLPDDGFYYKAFTSIALGWKNLNSWDALFHSSNFVGDLLGVSWETEKVTDTNSFVEWAKGRYPEQSENFELAKNKFNVNTWMDFRKDYLSKTGGTKNSFMNKDEYFDFDKLDSEVMPQIAALAEAWMEANFMGTSIPEDMTTEDFKTYIDTNAAYTYFASKGILPYQIDNGGFTRESFQNTGLTEEQTRELFVTDKVSIWTDYEYVNFMMPCTSQIYLKTEDGEEAAYVVKFRIVVKPEKNDDGSWSFKLDYATFEQYINAMDKWGTISDPKACTNIKEKATL